MIIIAMQIFTLCALGIILTVLLTLGFSRLFQGERNPDRPLHKIYLRELHAYCAHDSKRREPPHFPGIESGNMREELAIMIAALLHVVSDYDSNRLRRIVEENRLEEALLTHLHLHRGPERAVRMHTLLHLPFSTETSARLSRLTSDSEPHVAFYALLATIGTDSRRIIPVLRNYPALLTPEQAADVVRYMQRKHLQIDYKRLLSAHNDNLNILGLFIVGSFHIDQAQEMVYGLLPHENPRVEQIALSTAALLMCPLNHPNIVASINRKSETERRDLYRSFIREGYSLKALHELIETEHKRGSSLDGYILKTISSRKRILHKHPELQSQ